MASDKSRFSNTEEIVLDPKIEKELNKKLKDLPDWLRNLEINCYKALNYKYNFEENTMPI